MATDKKPATCYLSSELEQALSEYCESKGLVRDYKNGKKPQLGTAIVEILESHFFGDEQEDASPPPDEISELKGIIYDLVHRVESLESTAPSTAPSNGLTETATIEAIEDSTVPSTVVSTVETSNSTAPSNGVSNGLAETDAKPELEESTVPSTVVSTPVSEDTNKNSNNGSTPAEIAGGGGGASSVTNSNDSIVASTRLTKAQLAERFKLAEKSLDNMKGQKEFAEWSKKKDPEGIKWKWNYDTKIFERVS